MEVKISYSVRNNAYKGYPQMFGCTATCTLPNGTELHAYEPASWRDGLNTAEDARAEAISKAKDTLMAKIHSALNPCTPDEWTEQIEVPAAAEVL